MTNMRIHASVLNFHASGNVINIYDTVFLSLDLAAEHCSIHHTEIVPNTYI